MGTLELTEDSFAEFVSTLEGMGLYEYTGYYTTAYERYLKKIAKHQMEKKRGTERVPLLASLHEATS